MRSSLEETETKKTGTLSDGQRTVEIESETEKRGRVHFLRGRKNDRREGMKLDQIGFWSEIKVEKEKKYRLIRVCL